MKHKIKDFVEKFAKAQSASQDAEQARNLPVGTVKNGRQKVSAMPAKWVDVGSGQSYGAHHHEEPHNLDHNLEVRNHINKYMSKFLKYMDPEDTPLIMEKTRKYMESVHNMHNMNKVKASPDTAGSKQHTTTKNKLMTTAEKAKQELMDAVKESKNKKKKAQKNG